jgi:hypothetical protein
LIDSFLTKTLASGAERRHGGTWTVGEVVMNVSLVVLSSVLSVLVLATPASGQREEVPEEPAAAADTPAATTTTRDTSKLQVAVGRIRFVVGTDSVFTVEGDNQELQSFTYDAATKVYADGIEIVIAGLRDNAYVRVYHRGDPTVVVERIDVIKPYGAYDGIWRKTIAFGMEFAQERGDFSEQDLILQVSNDTMLWPKKRGRTRWHSYVDIGLRTIPNAEGDTEAKEDRVDGGDSSSAALSGRTLTIAQTDSVVETFLASRKAVHVETGLYVVWELQRETQVLNYGVGTAHGFNTITEFDDEEARARGTEDTVNRFHTVFFRLAMHDLVPPGVNPRYMWTFDLGYGYFENFFSKEELEDLEDEFNVGDPEDRRNRFIADAQMRIPGTRNLFLGIVANVGKGSDDVRLYGTIDLDLDVLRSAIGQ